jgi:ADP-heptose:LPS heptosyltransferase
MTRLTPLASLPADVFAGINSGPAHVANAVGTPVPMGVYRRFNKYLPFSGGYADGSTDTLANNLAGPASPLTVLTVDKVPRATLFRQDMARIDRPTQASA